VGVLEYVSRIDLPSSLFIFLKLLFFYLEVSRKIFPPTQSTPPPLLVTPALTNVSCVWPPLPSPPPSTGLLGEARRISSTLFLPFPARTFVTPGAVSCVFLGVCNLRFAVFSAQYQ